MTQKQALQELLDKVEAGKRPWRETCDKDALGWDETSLALRAYEGSLNAAKALHNIVLPKNNSYSISGDGLCVKATVMVLPFDGGAGGNHYIGWDNKCPARAWLIAIIKALIAETEE